jgi:plasmid stability protein
MANPTIRKLDPAVKDRLRLRAAWHGHSMAEEARRILADAVAPKEPANASEAIRRHVAAPRGAAFDVPPGRPSERRFGALAGPGKVDDSFFEPLTEEASRRWDACPRA